MNNYISEGPAARVSQIVVQVVRELSHFVHSLNRAHSPFGEPRIWDPALASPSRVFAVHAFIVILILGPLAVIPLGIPNINIYILDLFVGVLVVYWLFHWKKALAYIFKERSIQFFFLFSIISLVSMIFSPVPMNSQERFISYLYFIRFVSYFSIFLTAYSVGQNKKNGDFILGKLGWVGVGVSVAGWFQYFLYPDLRNLFYLGWDPHFKRIFSTYFDPNFLGLILVFSLILIMFEKKKAVWFWVKSVSILITLFFTYSRSSYLAYGIAMAYLAVLSKKYFLMVVSAIIFTGILFLLPRPSGEGVKLERLFSITQRIENWKLALQIVVDHPLLGVGFNTVRYAKRVYLFEEDVDYQTNHSGAGLDNSFLFVAATTGIVGLIVFLAFLAELFIQGTVLVRITLVAAVVHSMFQNSLFFPWIMMWIWLVCGLLRKR